jgi:hypothetical protein
MSTVFEVEPFARLRVVRSYGLIIAGKTLGSALAIFVLLGLVAPNLVDQHKDVALAEALGCLVLAAGVLLWGLFQLIIDLRRFALAWRQISQAVRLHRTP